MDNTLMLFEDRKVEIEFYYSVLLDIENDTGKIQTLDNRKFFCILKSNFLLMLYNLVEACVVSGIMEIYENLNQSKSGYNDLIKEIQQLWSNNQIGNVFKGSQGGQSLSSYEKRVNEIITHVITEQPIEIQRDSLNIGGNLDARKIKSICAKHHIIHSASDKDRCLETVKQMRQNLAHGNQSFGDCARDMTLSQLEHIKDEVIRFIDAILKGMKNYYDHKLYLKESKQQ